MAHGLLIVLGENPHDQLLPYMADMSGRGQMTGNEKFDWYRVGGRFKNMLPLRAPKEVPALLKLLGVKKRTHVNQARKGEIIMAQFHFRWAVGILNEGVWFERDYQHECSDAKYDGEFERILDALPDHSLITIIDIHR